MTEQEYDEVTGALMGRRVRLTSWPEQGLEGVVTGHRWRAENPYGGGVGSYPVFTITTPDTTVGGVDQLGFEVLP